MADWSLTKKSADTAEKRLKELEAERAKGVQMLQAAQQQAATLQQDLLRIDGAISVIREMLNGSEIDKAY